MRNEISLSDSLSAGPTKADFRYAITPNTITITDTGQGKLSVDNDLKAVLRKIKHWHQGSITAFKILYKDAHGAWHAVGWDGQTASLMALAETEEKARRTKPRAR